METEYQPRTGRKLIWGLFLIGLGGAFLMDRLGMIEMPNIGRLWPLIFPVIGVIQIAEGRPGSGIMFILMGAWFAACNEEWMGLDYGNSWPLLLVVMGLGIVIRALTNEDARRRRSRGVS